MMKKLLSCITVVFVLILVIWTPNTKAQSTYCKLALKVVNLENMSNTKIYILLPEKYIQYAITHDGLQIDNTKSIVDVLKQIDIPSIQIKKENVQDKKYTENGVEYVQILFENNENMNYDFNILSSYSELDIKYRIKDDTRAKDYIVHIDNFKIKNDICNIIYDDISNIVKQPDETKVPLATIILIILAVIIIIIAIIAKIKNK